MTIFDKEVILSVADEDGVSFLAEGAIGPQSGLYIWEVSTTITLTHQWLTVNETAARISWTSTNPDARFFVFVDGIQRLSNSLITFIDISVQVGQNVFVQVFDSENDIARAGFPNRFTLGWFRVPATAQYRVEEFVSAVWIVRARINDLGEGFFQFISGPLADDTVHQFRVIPVGTNGNDGTALTFSTRMIRIPDPPSVVHTYNGSGTPTFTVTAV